ncbi:hypothetical protein WJ977_23590 [Achromobacter xylosoxidans]
MRQGVHFAVVVRGAPQVRQPQRCAQRRGIVPRVQRRIAQQDRRLDPVVVEQRAHSHRRHARIRQVIGLQGHGDAGRLDRVAVARKGQHPPVRVARRGRRQGDGLARDVGRLRDMPGLHPQLNPRALQRRGIRRDGGGGVRLGDGAFPLLGAAQQAGEQAAVVGARRIGLDQPFQRGDRRFQSPHPHERRHQQAARIAPALFHPRQRRPELGHGLQGVVRLQDPLDDRAQAAGGIAGGGVCDGGGRRRCRCRGGAGAFYRRINHGAIL